MWTICCSYAQILNFTSGVILVGRENIRNADISHKAPSQKAATWCFPNREGSTSRRCVALAEKLHFLQEPQFFKMDKFWENCQVSVLWLSFPTNWENIHIVLVIRFSGNTFVPQITHAGGCGAGMSFRNIKAHPQWQRSSNKATCPSLFNKGSRKWDPIIQVCEPRWAFSFKPANCCLLPQLLPPPPQGTSCLPHTSLRLMNLLPQLP